MGWIGRARACCMMTAPGEGRDGWDGMTMDACPRSPPAPARRALSRLSSPDHFSPLARPPLRAARACCYRALLKCSPQLGCVACPQPAPDCCTAAETPTPAALLLCRVSPRVSLLPGPALLDLLTHRLPHYLLLPSCRRRICLQCCTHPRRVRCAPSVARRSDPTQSHHHTRTPPPTATRKTASSSTTRAPSSLPLKRPSSPHPS